MSGAIELSRLTAGYRELPVVRDLTLSVAEGEVVALLGANGAGKTTTLLTAAGVLKPLSGEIRLFGRSVAGRRPDRIAREGLALVPEDRGVLHRRDSESASIQLRDFGLGCLPRIDRARFPTSPRV